MTAGDEAMAVGGPDEAARHYELALELVADTDVAAAVRDARGSFDQIDLAVRASTAAAAAGHPFRAIALAEDQLGALPAEATPLDRARLLHALASVALITDSKVDVLAVTTEATRLVTADAPGQLRAAVLAVHARANADRARDEEATMWAREALHLAIDLDLAAVAADAATTLASLGERAGDPAAAEASLMHAVERARAANEVTAELRGLFNLGSICYEQGQLSRALEIFRESWQRAKQAGRPWAPYGLESRAMAAIVAEVSGDWQLATETVDVSGESPPDLAEALLAAAGLAAAAGRGNAGALELLPALRQWWHRDGFIAILGGAGFIDLLAEIQDVTAAEAIHDEVVASVTTLWHRSDFQARIRLGALLLGQFASAAAHAGVAEREELARRGDELARTTRAVAASGPGCGPEQPTQGRMNARRRRGPESAAWVARLEAEHARLRWLSGVDPPDEGALVDLWQRAVDGFGRFGHVYETARSRARLAAVLRATGDSARASEQILDCPRGRAATGRRAAAQRAPWPRGRRQAASAAVAGAPRTCRSPPARRRSSPSSPRAAATARSACSCSSAPRP